MIPEPGDDDFGPDEEDFDYEELDDQAGGDPDQFLGDEADDGREGGRSEHQPEPGQVELQDTEGRQPQVRQPSRAQARVEAALREAREATARAQQLEQQLRDSLSRSNQASEAERERALLEQMDPIERAEYRAQAAERRMEQTANGLRQEMAEANDRAAFAAACAANPALAKVKDQVEAQLADSRRNGVNIQREVLAAYIIGQQVLAKAPAAGARQRKSAATRVENNRARPVTSGSDVQGGRVRDEAAARRARLEDAPI